MRHKVSQLLIKFIGSTGTVAGSDWTYLADHVLYSKAYYHLLASVKNKVSNVYDALLLAIFQNCI
jgi:hypothetical protein